MTISVIQFSIVIAVALLPRPSVLLGPSKASIPEGNHKWYSNLFTQISKHLNKKQETINIFRKFQFEFSREINSIAQSIKPSMSDVKLDPKISTGAQSNNENQELATKAYGDGSDLISRDKKTIICGARGKVVQENGLKAIRIIALAEVMHLGAGSIVAGYATVQQNGIFNFDIKVSDNYLKRSMGSQGEFVVSKIISNKMLLNEKKIAIASSSIYILSLGVDFVKFTVYHLVVGISIKSDAIYSQSIIDMQVYISSATDGLESHEGVFASTNDCSFGAACITKHYGFLKVGHNRDKRIQKTLGKSIITLNGEQTLAETFFERK